MDTGGICRGSATVAAQCSGPAAALSAFQVSSGVQLQALCTSTASQLDQLMSSSAQEVRCSLKQSYQ